MSIPERETLTSVGSLVIPASMHQYVHNIITIKILTLVPPHVLYDFGGIILFSKDGTKPLKDLPSLIISKLNTDMDVKVMSWHKGAWRMLYERSIFKGTLKEGQDKDKITIAEYFEDHPNQLYVIKVPKQ
jgi:hypothetical protein